MHEISPRAYLNYYFEECAKKGITSNEAEIGQFLPSKLSEDLKKELWLKQPQTWDSS